MIPILLSFLIISISNLFGREILHRIKLKPIHLSQQVALSTAIGLGFLLTIIWIFALLSNFNVLICFIVFLFSLFLSFKHLADFRLDLTNSIKYFNFMLRGKVSVYSVFFYFSLLQILILFISELAPLINDDSIAIYLNIPKYWVLDEKYFHPTSIGLSSIPGLVLVLNSVGLLLNGPNLAMLLSGWWMYLFSGIGVYALTRVFASQKASILSLCIFVLIPDVTSLALSTKIDLGWNYFEISGIIAFCLFLKKTNIKYLFLMGIFNGFAISSKYSGLFSVFIFTIFIIYYLFHKKYKKRKIFFLIGLYLIGILFTFWPSYSYNFYHYSNPFHPMLSKIFNLLFDAQIINTHPVKLYNESGFLSVFTSLWNMFFKPGFANSMGQNAGIFIPMLIPLAFFIRKKNHKEVKWLLIFALFYSIIWYLTRQRTRHFLPALSILSSISGWVLWELIKNDYLKYKKICLFCILLILSFQFLLYNRHTLAWRIPTVLGIKTENNYLNYVFRDGQKYPNFNMINYINGNIPDSSRIVSPWNYSGFYIKNELMTHEWVDGKSFNNFKNMDQLLIKLKESSITHLLYNNVLIEKVKKKYRYNPILISNTFIDNHLELVHESGSQKLFRIIN